MLNECDGLEIKLDRSKVPAGIMLYMDVLDPILKRKLRRHVQASCDEQARRKIEVVESCVTLVHHRGREVFALPDDDVVSLRLATSAGARIPIVVGATRTGDAADGTYVVTVVQRDADGTRSSSAAVQFRV